MRVRPQAPFFESFNDQLAAVQRAAARLLRSVAQRCRHGISSERGPRYVALSPRISGKYVVFCLDDRVARKPALGVILLRWLVS